MSTKSDLESISLAWEEKTGFDSIATIKRMYGRTGAGSYYCVWPDCYFKHKDPAKMWRHVHTAHGAYNLPPEPW